MIYTVRVKATRRNLGDFEAPDPCQALAAMLVSRGVSAGSGDLLARVLDGLEAVPVARDFAESLSRLGSNGHAEISGRLAGLEFSDQENLEMGIAALGDPAFTPGLYVGGSAAFVLRGGDILTAPGGVPHRNGVRL